MKRLVIATILVAVGVGLRAECPYFRSSAKLLRCAAPDPKAHAVQDPYPSVPSDIPELDHASSEKPLVQVACTCSYSLAGSDPRCDTDQTLERSVVMGVDSIAAYCRRGDSVCREVCADRLP